MAQPMTFGRKLALGFGVATAFVVVVGLVGIFALRSTVADKDQVIDVHAQSLILAERLAVLAERRVSNLRGYWLTKDAAWLESMHTGAAELDAVLARLEGWVGNQSERARVEEIRRAAAAHRQAADAVVARLRSGAPHEQIVASFDAELSPAAIRMRDAIEAYSEAEDQRLQDAKDAATDAATVAQQIVLILSGAAILLAGALGFALVRNLGGQIGGAVQRVRSSSSELQTAANQQASGAREQATAMKQVNTTMNELVATARQISESARRVATIASDTERAGRAGSDAVDRARRAGDDIKSQVDRIAQHMLDLGKRSQQVGGILELINELSEQTNILAINATIEAASAGDSGRRFAAVGGEIRKLADRVGGSTKEIRALIEEMRSAVNATVMATESGAKLVDEGTRQFADVGSKFDEITALVDATTEAAREIELSTQQQAGAVEQVNEAVTGVAQSAAESEVGTKQTQQTATELTALSAELSRLVQTEQRA